LFIVVVTGFILVSLDDLRPPSSELTVQLLAKISRQLEATTVPAMEEETAFRPSPSALRVNVCWILSLTLGLVVSMFATLVQQWARHYSRTIASLERPREKGRMRALLRTGLERSQFTFVVEILPSLLHIAVFLFLGGLIEFLFGINEVVARVTLAIVTTCGGLYAAATGDNVANPIPHCIQRRPVEPVSCFNVSHFSAI
jgi:hypothetical protein